MNNVGVGGCKPLNPGSSEMWSFFDHGFLPGMNPTLSTFLMIAKTGRNESEQPVDKSVVKLWKDSAGGRSYWLGAIVGFT